LDDLGNLVVKQPPIDIVNIYTHVVAIRVLNECVDVDAVGRNGIIDKLKEFRLRPSHNIDRAILKLT